jgi:hypothetical protein
MHEPGELPIFIQPRQLYHRKHPLAEKEADTLPLAETETLLDAPLLARRLSEDDLSSFAITLLPLPLIRRNLLLI